MRMKLYKWWNEEENDCMEERTIMKQKMKDIKERIPSFGRRELTKDGKTDRNESRREDNE